jgi:hypothetical protein
MIFPRSVEVYQSDAKIVKQNPIKAEPILLHCGDDECRVSEAHCRLREQQ